LREILVKRGVAEAQFHALIQSIDRETSERLRDGEADHLIFYVLQSTRFTRRPRIEPSLSAREFVQSLTPAERVKYLEGSTVSEPGRRIPAVVRERIQDFLRELGQAQSDERMSWFRHSLSASQRTADYLCAEYARAMRFLYRKEFAGGPGGTLYQSRGHSSDTRIESSFAVATALAVLKTLEPGLRIERVLIAGPGLDFAPRTDLVDAYAPQSYQPYAVADALLALGLAERDRWRIDRADINDRVIYFFNEFPKRRERRLVLLRAWDDPEYIDYFRSLGRQIGTDSPIAGGKSLVLSKEIANTIVAGRLNVITERYDPPPEYDLVVATNVLVYFNDVELALALGNIYSMLGAGGYLIHNEPRPQLEQFSAALGFPPLQARTLRLSNRAKGALFDTFAIHRKQPAHHRKQ